MTEHQLQCACFEYFRWKYPNLTNNYFSIPNGMWSRNILSAIKCKNEGLKKGVFDSFLMLAKGDYHGFWIEFKVDRNKLTPEQRKFRDNAVSCGYRCDVVYTVDEFIKTIHEYLNENKYEP